MLKRFLLFGVASGILLVSFVLPQLRTSALNGYGTTRLALLDSHNNVPTDPDTTVLGYSGDGRYLFFWSNDGNLVPGDLTPNPNNNSPDLFRRDTVSGALELVNVLPDGSQGVSFHGPASEYTRVSSTDGRYVPFIDNGNCYVRDMLASSTRAVYKRSSPSDSCLSIAISADGQQAVFGAYMNGDINQQLFLYHVDSQSYTMITKDNLALPGNNRSELKDFSADGTKILYFTESTNLGPEPHQAMGSSRTLQYDTLLANTSAYDNISDQGCGIIDASDDFSRFSLTCVYTGLADGAPRQSAAYYKVADDSIVSIVNPTVMSDKSGISAGHISPDGTKIALQYLEDNAVNALDTNNSVDGGIFDLNSGQISLSGIDSSGIPGNRSNTMPRGFPNDNSKYIFSSISTNLTNINTGQTLNWFEHFTADDTASPTYDFTAPRVSKLGLSANTISSAQSTTINVKATDHYGINRVEYFIDNDPYKGYGSPLTSAPHDFYNATLPGGDLAAGTHTVYVRAVDTSGNWSQLLSTTLLVQ